MLCTDGTARDLTHFIGEDGTVHFDPGEDHKDILIPILNDPDGERVLFEVELHDLEGPGCLDVNDHATVAIDNLAGNIYLQYILFYLHSVSCNSRLTSLHRPWNIYHGLL